MSSHRLQRSLLSGQSATWVTLDDPTVTLKSQLGCVVTKLLFWGNLRHHNSIPYLIDASPTSMKRRIRNPCFSQTTSHYQLWPPRCYTNIVGGWNSSLSGSNSTWGSKRSTAHLQMLSRLKSGFPSAYMCLLASLNKGSISTAVSTKSCKSSASPYSKNPHFQVFEGPYRKNLEMTSSNQSEIFDL